MKKLFVGFFIIVLFLSLSRSLVLAGGRGCPEKGLVPCGNVDTCPCEFCDFFVMLDRIVDFLLFQIVPPLAVLMIAIGGGMYIIGLGNPAMLSRAKSLFTAVVLGLLIIYGAWLFVNFFFMLIGINEVHFQGLPQNWFKINCP